MNEIVYVGKHLLTYSVTRHIHTNWEFIFCTGGKGVFHFDSLSLPYGEGDVIVIPPQMPHTNESTEGFTNIHINMLEPTLTAAEPYIVKADSNGFLLNAFSAAFFHFSEPDGKNEAILAAYGDLIVHYLTFLSEMPECSQIVREIENHIIKNYPDCDFELDEYLRSLPFSYDYLRKLFKKELGVTPHRYLSDKRLEIAASCLSSEADGRNIAEIAHLCGFREPLYFSRMFKKKFGVSPSGYPGVVQRNAMLDSDSIKILL